MAEFDRNFTTFPDHPFTESNEDSNFVSSIFNKVKSITSAASNVVHNALPLPNHDPLITPENAHTVIASAQLSRPGRLLSNHAPVRLPARSHPQALKELKYGSASHSRNSSGGSFKIKNGASSSDISTNVSSHNRKVSLGRNTTNASLSDSMQSISSIDTPPLIKVTNFNGDHNYFSPEISTDDHLDSPSNSSLIHDKNEDNTSPLTLPGTLSGNEDNSNSSSGSSVIISSSGVNVNTLQPVLTSSSSPATTTASAAALFTPSASSLSLQNSKLTSDATVDRRNVTASGTFTTPQPAEIFNLRQQNSKLSSSKQNSPLQNPIISSQTNNSLSLYHHTPHHSHISGSHHLHHHHRTHKPHHRPHPMTPIPSATVVATQSNQQNIQTRNSPSQGFIGSTLGTISQGMESLQSKLSLSSTTDTTINAVGDSNLDSSYPSSFRENGSVLEKDYNSDAESIYSTAKRYFNSRVDRRPTPLKNGGLGKEFWMKDEHVTECFGCTAKFTSMFVEISFLLLLTLYI